MTREAFTDRRAAGQALAARLTAYQGEPDLLVLGLARGGVPVASEVARALDAPLDVFVVRKIGAPGRPELALGAVASGDVIVLNDDVIHDLHVSTEALRRIAEAERRELRRREDLYRGGRAPEPLSDQTVILVDDGMATGASMRAAVAAVRRQGAAKVVVALPTAPLGARADLGAGIDDFVCVLSPTPFLAVSRSYRRFDQTSDQEVIDLLRE